MQDDFEETEVPASEEAEAAKTLSNEPKQEAEASYNSQKCCKSA